MGVSQWPVGDHGESGMIMINMNHRAADPKAAREKELWDCLRAFDAHQTGCVICNDPGLRMCPEGEKLMEDIYLVLRSGS